MTAAEQTSFPLPVAGLTPVSLPWANTLLARWDHYLGPCGRPFGAQAWTLEVEGRPVAVAVSASTVSDHITGTENGQPVRLRRGEIVELARLYADPGSRWATRPMLRLWREVAAPRWPYWPVTAAISYSQNSKGDGSIYRFDGWARIAERTAQSGGDGVRSWSKTVRPGAASYGAKSLWLWRYEPTAVSQ